MSLKLLPRMKLEVKVLVAIALVLAVLIGAGHYFTSGLQQRAILERVRHRAASIVQDVMDMRKWQAEEARKESEQLSKLPQPIRVVDELGRLFAREAPLSHPNEYGTRRTDDAERALLFPTVSGLRSAQDPRWYYWRTLTAAQLSQQIGEAIPPSAADLAGGRTESPDGTGSEAPYRQFERDAFHRIMEEKALTVESDLGPTDDAFYFAQPLVVHGYCLNCHAHRTWRSQLGKPIGIISVELGLAAERADVAASRNISLWTAVVTILATLIVLYLLIRLLILKPLGHLKEVSDRISEGDLTVRAHVHTGDELESFGNVFNRMLQNVEESQTRLHLVNRSLDEKLNELGLANLRLLEMNRLKSEFLANVSHELRTPLNSIIGFSELLTGTQEAQLDTRQQRYVGNIQSSGKRLLRLINELLDLARIESGRMEVRLGRVSLAGVIEGIKSMREESLKPHMKLELEIARSLPGMVTDEGKLTQILDNLVTNAIKFTDEGGLVRISARPEGADVVICVIDNGVGIAPEHQTLVFEKFRQVDGSTTRKHTGAGLGLSIVKELTTLLGGTITLVSEPGKGSTFTVRLPVELTAENVTQPRPEAVWG